MPPAYVKPYVKRGKTDAADAEAIAEAVTRPTMRFVAVKTAEQQAVLMLHKVQDLLVRQRTMLINALRGHLAEFGIIAARGPGGVTAAIVALHETQDSLPVLAKVALARPCRDDKPVEPGIGQTCVRGVRPSQAANWRPDLKSVASGTHRLPQFRIGSRLGADSA
jgi:hypothetical protein